VLSTEDAASLAANRTFSNPSTDGSLRACAEGSAAKVETARRENPPVIMVLRFVEQGNP
jgi:hypothetical protein